MYDSVRPTHGIVQVSRGAVALTRSSPDPDSTGGIAEHRVLGMTAHRPPYQTHVIDTPHTLGVVFGGASALHGQPGCNWVRSLALSSRSRRGCARQPHDRDVRPTPHEATAAARWAGSLWRGIAREGLLLAQCGSSVHSPAEVLGVSTTSPVGGDEALTVLT